MKTETQREPSGGASRRDVVKGFGLGLAASAVGSSLAAGPAAAQATIASAEPSGPVNTRNLPIVGKPHPSAL